MMTLPNNMQEAYNEYIQIVYGERIPPKGSEAHFYAGAYALLSLMVIKLGDREGTPRPTDYIWMDDVQKEIHAKLESFVKEDLFGHKTQEGDNHEDREDRGLP